MSEITVPDPDDLILGKLDLDQPSQVNRSAWTGRRKVVGLPGAALWTGQAAIDVLTTEVEERPWRAFLWGLNGPKNWFKWTLPCNSHAGGKPLVASGATAGNTLPLSGLTVSTTILTAGQFITVPLPSGHSRAVCLTADLVSNGAGGATASFVPALGEVPTLGATVETKDPFIPMSLAETQQGFGLEGSVSGASFAVVEAL